MPYPLSAPGPFRVDQLRDGDPYELSQGHPVQCLPTGGNGSGPNGRGFVVLDTDPAAPPAGVDAGIALSDKTLRAPDVTVGIGPEQRGWSTTVPPLVVEYAAEGQDGADLRTKIDEFLAAGTRWVWVVRLTGPRRVEVHAAGKPMRVFAAGEELEAPGVLQNRVPVVALFDRDAAHEVALRNLLQRKGYDSLEAIAAEGEARGRAEGEARGKAEGQAEALLVVLSARGFVVDEGTRATILACTDAARLRRWILGAVTAASPADALSDP